MKQILLLVALFAILSAQGQNIYFVQTDTSQSVPNRIFKIGSHLFVDWGIPQRSGFIAVIEAMQDLEHRVDSLQARVDSLESRPYFKFVPDSSPIVNTSFTTIGGYEKLPAFTEVHNGLIINAHTNFNEHGACLYDSLGRLIRTESGRCNSIEK